MGCWAQTLTYQFVCLHCFFSVKELCVGLGNAAIIQFIQSKKVPSEATQQCPAGQGWPCYFPGVLMMSLAVL